MHIMHFIFAHCSLHGHSKVLKISVTFCYNIMLNKGDKCQYLLHNRVRKLCTTFNMNFRSVWISKCYVNDMKRQLLGKVGANISGPTDSIRWLLQRRNPDNMHLLKLILKAF